MKNSVNAGFDEAKAAVDKYMVLARKAVAAGNDNDARVFLTEKNKRAAELATAETAYKAAQANADKMRQLYNKLSSDVATLQSRLKNIQAMSAVADAQKTVSKMTSKDYGGGLAKFDAMEERVRQQLDESSAPWNWLNSRPMLRMTWPQNMAIRLVM